MECVASQIALRFAYESSQTGQPAVLWVINLDPRGADDIRYRCKQVRLLCSESCDCPRRALLLSLFNMFE